VPRIEGFAVAAEGYEPTSDEAVRAKGLALMRRVLISLVSAVALLLGVPAGAKADTSPPLPNRMAALGDSITQAVDVCCSYGNHPANSWSTGGATWDSTKSHYERILPANANITGHNYTDSVAGAKMSNAPGQAAQAVAQAATYVTILMGANDVCTSSPSTMTPVSSYRSQFQQTLATLSSGLPGNAHIFVSSVPDVYQLWRIYHTSLTAQLVWQSAGICQSLLSPYRTEAQRQQVRQRIIAFNSVLQEECARYAKCRFDGNAVFGYQFTRSDVSTLDFFHPSLTGQAVLANLTWSKSWWG
jgi:lysophospholipase L1-like esterase